MIPISARLVTCSYPRITLRPYGPAITPVRIKATGGGIEIRLKIMPTMSAMAKMIRISVRSSETMQEFLEMQSAG
jgi:hypothetical protein